MPDDFTADLDGECIAFARYLTGGTPGPYVLEKYRDAHQRHAALRSGTPIIERALLAAARAAAPGAWLVDAYTAIFLKKAVVRKKWVLLVAILESCAPTADYFDRPDPGGRVAAIARLGGRGILFLVGLVLSMIVFLPIHLLSRPRPDARAVR
jgi:hypothetical protein